MIDEARRLRGDLAVAQNAVRLLVAENQRLRARAEDAETEIARLHACNIQRTRLRRWLCKWCSGPAHGNIGSAAQPKPDRRSPVA